MYDDTLSCFCPETEGIYKNVNNYSNQSYGDNVVHLERLGDIFVEYT